MDVGAGRDTVDARRVVGLPPPVLGVLYAMGGCQRHAELAGHGVTHLGGHGPHAPSSPLPLIPASPCHRRRPVWGGVRTWHGWSAMGHRGRRGPWRVVVVVVSVAWSLSSSRGGPRVGVVVLAWWSSGCRGGPRVVRGGRGGLRVVRVVGSSLWCPTWRGGRQGGVINVVWWSVRWWLTWRGASRGVGVDVALEGAE